MMTKKRFDINDYTGSYAMHCDTNEKAEVFLEYLSKVEKMYDSKTFMVNCGLSNEKLVHFVNNPLSGDEKHYSMAKILEFDDFDWSKKDKGSMVDHPDHYQGNKFEVIDIIEDFNLNFNLGSAIKYILRAGKKGDRNQDFEKAIWFIKRELGK